MSSASSGRERLMLRFTATVMALAVKVCCKPRVWPNSCTAAEGDDGALEWKEGTVGRGHGSRRSHRNGERQHAGRNLAEGHLDPGTGGRGRRLNQAAECDSQVG